MGIFRTCEGERTGFDTLELKEIKGDLRSSDADPPT